MKQNNNKAWIFTMPALLLLSFVAVIPLIMILNYSLHDIIKIGSKVWVGLEWYREILQDGRFWETLGRSLCFSIIILLIEIPLGITIALFLPKKGALVAVCLVSISLPLLVPWNMIAMIWHVFLEISAGSLSATGILFDWKLNAFHTWISIILMDIWHWTSLVVLLCYSSLTTIPDDFYYSAAIDGASRWSVFRYVELPRMRGVLLMAILLRFIDSFMVFTEPFILNAGGPRSSTTFLAMELGTDVASYDFSPAATRSIIYFVVVLTVCWIFYKALRFEKGGANSEYIRQGR
jgi:glycerol transport system permease protein